MQESATSLANSLYDETWVSRNAGRHSAGRVMLMLPEEDRGGAGQEGTRVSAVIMGEEYVIRGDAEAERIESLAREIDSRMRAIAEANPRLSTQQVAVLSALNLMGELVVSQRRYTELLNLLEQV